MTRKNYLDVVRAFAAFLVVVVHTQQHFPAPNRVIEIAASMGQLGVQLFFVLSAFLIFESLDRLNRKGGSLVEFFAHRFLRVAPLYYVAIAVFVVAFGLIFPAMGWSEHAPESYTAENIGFNLLFLHGIVPAANNTIVGGGWSIGTEMLFYLIAPALFALRNNRLALVGLATACYPLVLKLVEIAPHLSASGFLLDNSFLFFSLANQLPVFICGCLLFAMRKEAFAIPRWLAALGWIASISAASYIWVTDFTGTMTFFYVPLLAGMSGVFLIILMSKIEITNWLVLEFGRRAFSIYLFNMPALLIVKFAAAKVGVTLPFFAAVPIVAAAAFLAAGITYRFVERPSIEIARRLFSRDADQGIRLIER